MDRRQFVLVGGSVALSGCVDRTVRGYVDDRSTDATTAPAETVDSAVLERVKDCEQEYIRNVEVTRDDESIEGDLHSEVIDSEPRSEGVYVELETRYATIRSGEGEPDEHLDNRVTAYYLVTDDGVYRTEDADADPRDGTTVDC